MRNADSQGSPGRLMPRLDLMALEGAALNIPDRAAPPIEFAAQELQRYLGRIFGVRLGIVAEPALSGHHTLVLGADATAPGADLPAGDDGYRLVPEPARVTIDAGSPRGVLRGAYDLLRHLGCRWSLHPTEEEVVPNRTGGEIELAEVTGTPRFAVRGYTTDIMTWHYTQPEHFHSRLDDDRAFIDWMGKTGGNAFFFIRHPFDSQLTIPELLPDFRRRGIDVEYGGHVLPLLLPRELYATHPEYFPESPEGARTDHGNMCTSNTAALATVSANALAYVREFPEMRVVHVWGADLWQGGWCHCAACRGVSVQDQSLRVCNAVSGALSAAGLARPVCYLAYHDTIDPALTVRPDSNVVVEFAPRERCYGHALNDPKCATNHRYAGALERYVEIFNGRVRLFEYYGDAILFFGCAVPLTEVIDADLDYYRRLGITEITMLQFGSFSTWAYPLNFLAFANGCNGGPSGQGAAVDYCSQFGSQASGAAAAFSELEGIMRTVVTYGDIRRPPRSTERARVLLQQIDTALPRLAGLAKRLQGLSNERLAAQGTLVRYTEAVLLGVRDELQDLLAGRQGNVPGRYAAALPILEGVDRRVKGLWGSVDLPIIHSFYTAAAHASER